MFENFGEKLTQKMGPFPVWVWGVLVGGAFVAWYWFTNAGQPVDEEGTDGTDVGQVLAPSGDFSTVPVVPGPEEAVNDQATNAEWLVQALNAARSLPGVSILAAQTALEKYLSNTPLSAAEGAIVEKVLREVGPPPESVGAPSVSPSPTTPKPTDRNWATKTTVSSYKSTWFGNTLVIRAKVSWVNSAGHTFQPRGFVEIALDGAMAKRYRLLNGTAIRTVVIGRKVKQFQDKTVVITAKFLPNTGTSEKPSTATPWPVTIKGNPG